MAPVIQHLKKLLPELPLPKEGEVDTWTFDREIQNLGDAFYRKAIPLHPLLNLEYSILCQQLRTQLEDPGSLNTQYLKEQLVAALFLAQFLEHIHQHYLIVPREVVRLQKHQEVYKELLTEVFDYVFIRDPSSPKPIETGLSLSQRIREETVNNNQYRLFLTRSKRVLYFLDLVGTGSDVFSDFVAELGNYTDRFFAYLSWCIFTPRFVTNLFLMFKHCVPGSWMNEREQGLGFGVRVQTQLQRRFFELSNDTVWVAVGLINCFLLVGPLASYAIYLTVGAFAFDVVNAGIRLIIELKRHHQLHTDYKQMAEEAPNAEEKQSIKAFQNHVKHRKEFEMLRLGLSLANATAVFLAMTLALPVLAINPLIPLVGAVLLLIVWAMNYTLTSILPQYRPNDAVEKPTSPAALGFFSAKAASKPQAPDRTPTLQGGGAFSQ